MVSKNLLSKMTHDLAPKSSSSVNVNIKFEGAEADKLELLSVALGRSKTETVKYIVTNSLDDLIKLVEATDQPEESQTELERFDQTVLELAVPKIASLVAGSQFELKDLLGEDWLAFQHGDKNRCGKVFKRLVDEGVVTGVKFVRTKRNRHALYEKL